MAAFLAFAEEEVDIAVVEVGIGGRLDATNIITPEVTVITSIGWDHMEYLGDTLEKITAQKAGIMKEGVPTIVGPTVNIPAAIQVQGPFAHFEEENQAIAKEALKQIGVKAHDLTIVPPARFEVRGDVVFDVAHNLPALEALFARLKTTYPNKKFRVLIAFSADKSHKQMLQFVQQEAAEVHVSRASHPRALQIGEKDLVQTFHKAKKMAKENGEMLVVCGTHFMMAPLRCASEPSPC